MSICLDRHEAFLFPLPETPPETKGRFIINETLPIPFSGAGSLEVDLLCATLVLQWNRVARNISRTHGLSS